MVRGIHKVFLLLAGVLVPLFLHAQTIGFTLKDNVKKVVIPFESYNNLIIVPVILNKALPLRFILDTGVRTTILTDRTFSDILQIQYNRKLTLLGADGDKGVDAYVAGDVSLELPGTKGEGQVMLVLEEDYLQLKNYLGEEVHGILGYEIFRRFTVEINYDAHLLILYEPSSYKPRRSYEAIPITVEDTKPYLTANITPDNHGTIKAKLMIDTGASHSLLLDASSHRAISLPENKVRCTLGRGLGGDINGFVGRVNHISIEKFDFKKVVCSFPDTTTLGEVFKATGRQGTLGAGILRRFTVVVDYYNNKLYLKKNRQYKKGFEYNMSGIELVAIGRDLRTFVVQDIRPDSPARKAGVREGDILKRVNGVSSINLDLSKINSLFRSKEGKKIRLKIEREGEIIKRVFKLERLI